MDRVLRGSQEETYSLSTEWAGSCWQGKEEKCHSFYSISGSRLVICCMTILQGFLSIGISSTENSSFEVKPELGKFKDNKDNKILKLCQGFSIANFSQKHVIVVFMLDAHWLLNHLGQSCVFLCFACVWW